MNVTINPGKLKGRVSAPPSKSYAHRMLICSALAEGKSIIEGISGSQDMLATLDCVSALLSDYVVDKDVVTMEGGYKRKAVEKAPVFKCRESGSTLRFFIPIALAFYDKAEFVGTSRLIERGIGIYEDLFKTKGITIEKSLEAISFKGGMTPGEYSVMGNVSSQFITGLLFALPLLDGDSVLKVIPPVESRPYIDITLDVIRRFGIEITEIEENVFRIKGNQHYKSMNEKVEGDWSNAAALLAFNQIGGDIEVEGLNYESRQGDKICVSYLDKLNEDNPVIDISDCPDLGPVLFATAAAKNGATFTGTKRLRIKESDRATAMKDELIKFGISTEVFDNEVVIHKGKLKKPVEIISGHNDHRIVMACSLLLSITGGEISEAESINKSYPNFFDNLTELGLEVINEA